MFSVDGSVEAWTGWKTFGLWGIYFGLEGIDEVN